MSNKRDFQKFLKEYDEVTGGDLKNVEVNMEEETISDTTSKLAYRSIHAPTYEIKMTFHFSQMMVYAEAEMEDEGDGEWDSDERPFYGGDCGEIEIEDADNLAGVFDDTDWIDLDF